VSEVKDEIFKVIATIDDDDDYEMSLWKFELKQYARVLLETIPNIDLGKKSTPVYKYTSIPFVP